MKFTADGTIVLTAKSSITYTGTQHRFGGPVQMDNTLLVKQNVTAQGCVSISGDNGTGNASSVSRNMVTNNNLSTSGTLTNNGRMDARELRAIVRGMVVSFPGGARMPSPAIIVTPFENGATIDITYSDVIAGETEALSFDLNR
ncbi:hypothetical protein BPMI_02406c [Candidatus Burkholderia pumila]|uniref:Uncharacterized protein n=1 Tax=Candidatus Burkholderia pumila TaxID=1090375 RepID=A0ABR5HLT8_9BURK|nr:hypothetical protein BPMI_02406c [Candidatus Burkholderia pumila]